MSYKCRLAAKLNLAKQNPDPTELPGNEFEFHDPEFALPPRQLVISLQYQQAKLKN